MANQTDIDDLLQCPICLEIFDQPKVLDCQHTFCSNCLKIHQSSQSESFSIECPMCRRRSNLINNSIESLPSNLIVRDLIERQYGNERIERSTPQQLKKNDQNDYMNYVKPAAAALMGVLGGLLLAKGVSKMTDRKKKSTK